MPYKISVSDAYLKAFDNVHDELLQLIKTDDEKLLALSKEYFTFSDKIINQFNKKSKVKSDIIIKLVEQHIENLKKTLLE